ncbi:MAG: thiamine ABC transporter substrate binding subunit [Rhodobacteraceae bacterium]|nr:thiamine ABC transporter substrate binding subunit [Paracoccaceae bacterium]
MKKILMSAALLTSLGGALWAQDKPELIVYTYDSFVTDWGPGPAIETAFEAVCECELTFVPAGDGAALLSRVWLEGERSEADVVLGLDNSLMEPARDMGIFAPHNGIPENLSLPVGWTDDTFLPFDWGYLAFVYDNTKITEVPDSFAALAASDLSIVIEDPRSSTPGLGLVFWVKTVYGDDAAGIWEDLSDNIVTVTKGWSEAYGMFLEGEADMVLSYTTSPAYHLIAEEDSSKSAAIFTEGHFMQIEVAAKLAHTDQNELADMFLAFMADDAFQSVIPTTNWMYPVTAQELPAGFDTLTTPTPIDAVALTSDFRDEALSEWLSALSQ